MTNIDILENTQIVTGDNTGENLKGILTSIPAFTPVASGISDASIYDLLVKVREDIVSAGGSKYRPDFAMMKLSLINQMKLKKDANENYILPPFVDRNGEVVDGMVVVAEESVPANELIVGDRRFGRVYRKSGVLLSTGYVDAQFSSDLMTLKARKRLAFLIRQADASGFRKVTSVSAALITLATA
jgi:HK97 family phage major capsid protein